MVDWMQETDYLQLTAGLSGPRLLSTGKDPNIASDLLTRVVFRITTAPYELTLLHVLLPVTYVLVTNFRPPARGQTS